jgi:outer membrane protein OmpA-like peptidoglycan-associated protein
MGKRALVGLVVLSFFVVFAGLMGCAKKAYFGVDNQAMGVPGEFGQTEAAIAKAEGSPGAQYAPEKLAKARELGKKGIETYWGCRTEEAMAMLAEARRLAGEAEVAKAPPKAKPAPVAAAPKPKPAPAKPKPAPAKKPPVVAAVPKPVSVTRVTKKVIYFMGGNFAFDSAELTPETRTILDDYVALLKKESFARVEIAGHTDSIGPEEYNQGLSEKRANAVMEYLISKGMRPESLKTMGYGESRPITTNDTREGRERNRRVELKVVE